jgi:hypothetical protein
MNNQKQLNLKLEKVSCLEIEVAIMREFDYRTNIIVPNISNMMGIVPFETDMLVLTKAGYAHGFEIKTSKSDLKADFKKPHHTKFNEIKNGKVGIERFYSKFKFFSYAVPEQLKECALELIPDFCGLWVYRKEEFPSIPNFYCERKPTKLTDYKWSEKQIQEITRLGTMRIYGLKYGALYRQQPKENNINISDNKKIKLDSSSLSPRETALSICNILHYSSMGTNWGEFIRDRAKKMLDLIMSISDVEDPVFFDEVKNEIDNYF